MYYYITYTCRGASEYVTLDWIRMSVEAEVGSLSQCKAEAEAEEEKTIVDGME